MSESVITVENLGKKYRLGTTRHDTLRDRIVHAAKSVFRSRPDGTKAVDEFWALRDVSFEVKRGEVLGIVGRNGAGKSTLLKVLSRITEPTTGRIALRGRVASLLEVGTGFHPELTGRENIYLNGAILGMSRVEIRRKFDEIVAFAEVERFLDTQVKHYSSGMYVRLAFAVAAHLEPEILIVDEVLAVGDIAFQKKCIGKMESVSQQDGRTVLFVSHNLHVIRRLCRSAILLDRGEVATVGTAAQVLDEYNRRITANTQPARTDRPTANRETAAVIEAAIETADGQGATEVPVGASWRIRTRFRIGQPCDHFVVGVGLIAADGTAVQTAWHPPQNLSTGQYEAVFNQCQVMLESGHYTIVVGLSQNDHTLQQLEIGAIDISNDHVEGYFPLTAGVGTVLNSMRTTLRSL